MTRLIAAAFSLALLAGTAHAQEQESAAAESDSMMSMMTMRPGMEMSEADRGYVKAMQTMQQNMMKTEMTGDPSGDFVRMMIPHHQSAVDMAEVLLQQKDVDPEVRKMAEKMKAEQKKEIDRMQAWLESHAK